MHAGLVNGALSYSSLDLTNDYKTIFVQHSAVYNQGDGSLRYNGTSHLYNESATSRVLDYGLYSSDTQ
jgi:hypothetical protein